MFLRRNIRLERQISMVERRLKGFRKTVSSTGLTENYKRIDWKSFPEDAFPGNRGEI
jgi:hypothetical protein